MLSIIPSAILILITVCIMWFTTVTSSKIQILNNDIINMYNSIRFQNCKQLSTHMKSNHNESHHAPATELDTAQTFSHATKLNVLARVLLIFKNTKNLFVHNYMNKSMQINLFIISKSLQYYSRIFPTNSEQANYVPWSAVLTSFKMLFS